ncbi:MAG: histidine phosphatase family protein [Actinomycetia bacterium]|nr:histidine phosphatase family protein [Actinomycetes bacterium]
MTAGPPRLPAPPSALLVLIRHAVTVGRRDYLLAGRTDLPLSPAGRRQARALGRYLADWPLAGIYHSPLRRAWATADGIARRHPGVPRAVHPDLREIDLGIVDGWPAFAAWERWPALFAEALDPTRADFAFPGGESRSDALRRFLGALADVVRRHPGGVVAVVTHGALLGLALATWTGEPPGWWRRFQPPWGSLTLVEAWPDGPTVGARVLARGLTGGRPPRLRPAWRLPAAGPSGRPPRRFRRTPPPGRP